MQFEQYTRCVDPSLYKPRSYALMTAQAAAVSSPFVLAAVGAGHWACLVIAATILGLAWWIFYCRNFLYERLICLSNGMGIDLGDKPPAEDHDALGVVISVSPPPGALAPDWDNDYSINLLLQCTPFNVSQEVAQETPPFGFLIKGQPAIENPPVSRETPGYDSVDKKGTGKTSWGLHVEFEGAGIFNSMQWFEGMLGVATVAFLLCMWAPWPIDLILAGFVFLAALLGWLVSKFVRSGSPSDVNPDLPTIHENTTEDGRVVGAHILYVQGTWVFDPLHKGWNEIHPVKVCTQVRRWEGDWTDFECGPATPGIILRLRKGFEEARAQETLANQAVPEHLWVVHPDLDGCARVVIL